MSPNKENLHWNKLEKAGIGLILLGLCFGVPQVAIYGTAALAGGYLLH